MKSYNERMRKKGGEINKMKNNKTEGVDEGNG